MKKNLAAIALGATLLFSGGLKANAQPPEEYRKHLAHEEWVMVMGGFFYNKGYDIDKDGIDEVGELYVTAEDKEPYIYAFNKNQNTVFEEEEIFVDEAMDGWNGNEVPYVK